MKDRVIIFLKTYPLFVLLLPIFFVFHAFTEYYNLVPLKDSLELTGTYLLTALIITGMSWLFFRNIHKAALTSFYLLAFNFFFGGIQDILKTSFPGSFMGRYSVLTSGAFILFIILIIILKRRRKTFYVLTMYLNYLLLLFILIDAIMLTVNISRAKQKKILAGNNFNSCTDCSRPDIYFIVADGYSGKQALKELFNYDNTAFEKELTARGFYIVEESKSNYNFTSYSVATTLNYEFLTEIEGSNVSMNDIRTCYNTISKNNTLKFLKKEGYDFYNYSIFDIDAQPSVAKPTFLQAKTKLIISQTFLYRIQRDLWYHLVTDLHLKSVKNAIVYRDLKNNDKIYSLTKEIAARKTENPKLVYTHLVYPHYPFYYDSTGKETAPDLVARKEYNTDKGAYISYLKYSNKELLKLIDHIIASSPTRPIISLISDHGFREFTSPVDPKYYFMNLNAILFPDKNYSGFYKGMSNINHFRVLLNTEFKQNLPMLKDSVSFLRE